MCSDVLYSDSVSGSVNLCTVTNCRSNKWLITNSQSSQIASPHPLVVFKPRQSPAEAAAGRIRLPRLSRDAVTKAQKSWPSLSCWSSGLAPPGSALTLYFILGARRGTHKVRLSALSRGEETKAGGRLITSSMMLVFHCRYFICSLYGVTCTWNKNLWYYLCWLPCTSKWNH